MSESIRTFIAVKLTADDSLRRLLRALSEMGQPVKSMSPDNLHVTLKFLGETRTDLLDAIQRQLAETVRPLSPFTAHVRGVGAFPHLKRPTVLWAGLEDAEPLVEISEELHRRLKRFGFQPEKRPFRPHLTLARIKKRPPDTFHTLVEEYRSRDFGEARIETVELFQSDLRPDGARYSVLASERFGAA